MKILDDRWLQMDDGSTWLYRHAGDRILDCYHRELGDEVESELPSCFYVKVNPATGKATLSTTLLPLLMIEETP